MSSNKTIREHLEDEKPEHGLLAVIAQVRDIPEPREEEDDKSVEKFRRDRFALSVRIPGVGGQFDDTVLVIPRQDSRWRPQPGNIVQLTITGEGTPSASFIHEGITPRVRRQGERAIAVAERATKRATRNK